LDTQKLVKLFTQNKLGVRNLKEEGLCHSISNIIYWVIITEFFQETAAYFPEDFQEIVCYIPDTNYMAIHTHETYDRENADEEECLLASSKVRGHNVLVICNPKMAPWGLS
jgi:hypothetical protein